VTAPAATRFACPTCGAPISFLWAQAVQTTCDFCKSVLVRTGLDLEKVGQQADFPATASPVQIGMQGRWGQRNFTVVGRLTYEWARGRWNEWYLRLSDGTGAWLSDAQLEYALTTEVAPGKPLPDPMSLSVGDTVATDRHRFVVTNITLAEYVGTEGELPFATGARALCTFVDLLTMDGTFATLDGSETPPLLFMGDYVTWDEMAPQGAREFEGW
jgi:hypothetical protein